MRMLRYLLIIVIILLIAVGTSVMFFGGAMIKTGVEVVGPRVLGVPVTLENARLSPLRGEAHLRGLHVGNPEGFKTDSLFDLGQMDIHLDLFSLLSDTIVIHRINIDAPIITYEQGVRRNNIGTLLQDLEKKAEEIPEEDEEKEDVPGKNLVIEELIISDARLNASFTAMEGRTVALSLPTIEMTDLGKEREPMTVAEVIREVLAVVAASAGQAVAGATDLVGEGAEAARDAARGLTEDATEAASEGIGRVREGIGGLLGRDKEE